jgi:hypothetical protein
LKIPAISRRARHSCSSPTRSTPTRRDKMPLFDATGPRSRYVHRYMHMPFDEALRAASPAMQVLLRSSLMRHIWRVLSRFLSAFLSENCAVLSCRPTSCTTSIECAISTSFSVGITSAACIDVTSSFSHISCSPSHAVSLSDLSAPSAKVFPLFVVGWLGWLVGWLVGVLVGWSVGWLVG